MSGDGETAARATLVEMQQRIGRGPNAVFGPTATPQELRAAFLALTKQFHPARFGRLSSEIQKLANEVFLGIKAAHESLIRTIGAPPRQSTASATAVPTPVSAQPSSRMSVPTSHPVAQDRTARSAVPSVPAAAQPVVPTGRATRPSVAPVPAAAQPVVPAGRATRPSVRAQPVVPAGRATRPSVAPVPAAAQPVVPAGRATRPSVPAQPVAPVVAQPARGNVSGTPSTRSPIAPGVAAPGTPTSPGEGAEVSKVHELVAEKNWTGAKNILNGLAARHPGSKPYRALLCYVRGREAQHSGKGEEAAMELQRALQLDPDLSNAKTALAELLRRR